MDQQTLQSQAAVRSRSPGVGPQVSVIMPTTTWGEPFATCAGRVLEWLADAAGPTDFIVVHDGPAPPAPAWLERPDVRVIVTAAVRGPAAARNAAAERARGGILFFLDADVEPASDALERVRATLGTDEGPVAVFGAYDDAPAAAGVVSRFRNLLHHHTHVRHPGRARTFWAGCGAVRAAQFHDVGGFDEAYARPSIEDIELGMRVDEMGGEIVLDPALRGKHHKRWTLWSMVATDVWCRAVPWSALLTRTGRLPAALAVDWRNRISGVLALAGLAAATVALGAGRGGIVAAACLAGVVVLNLDFYRLCHRRGGLGFVLAAVALHMLFFIYSALTFGVVLLRSFGSRLLRRSPGGTAPERTASAP